MLVSPRTGRNRTMLTMDAHPGPVHALTFTPGGTLVTAGAGGVRVWEPPELTREIGSLNEPVWCLAISPDGRFLAAGGPRMWLELIDRTGERPDHRIQCGRPITTIAYLSPTRFVYGLGDKVDPTTASCTLYFVDPPKLQPRKSFEAVNGIRALAADPPRNRLAWVTDTKFLTVQDVTRPAVKPVVLRKEARAVAFSPDGRKLAVTSDWDVLLYDADQWPSAPTTLGRHQGSVTALAFTPDSRTLYSGAVDQTVKVWEVDRGAAGPTFTWPVGRVTALAVAPDGLRAAAAGSDGKVAVWDVD
jgi:WD40 repeat protein